ncbi:MAG: MFS transporter [Ardenticatenaceae bacterium]|nr:MFS transporter [Ardenticatenaceae bacterium]
MKNIWPFSISFFFFACVAFIGPFTVLYYRELGFSGAQIGLLTGLAPLITMLSAPLWTGLADTSNRHRFIMSLTLLLSSLSMVLLPLLRSFLPVLLLVATFNLFFAPINSLADSATMFMLGEVKDRYGRVRVGGTFGFGLAAILAGSLVENYGLKMAFWGGSVMLFLGLLVSQKLEYNQSQKTTPIRQGARTLLQNRPFILFLAMAFAGGLNVATTTNYLLPYVKELGAESSIMGLILMTGTLAEIPILIFSHHLLKRFQPYTLVTLAVAISGVRLLLLAIINTIWLIFPVQLLNGLGYPLMWLAGVAYADQNAPPGLNATAQGLFGATVGGLGMAVGGFSGGLLLDVVSGREMFVIFGTIVLTIVGLVMVLGKRPYPQTASANIP